jgi:hypothetical protein
MWEVVSFVLIDLFSRTYKKKSFYIQHLVLMFCIISSGMDCSKLNKLELNIVY